MHPKDLRRFRAIAALAAMSTLTLCLTGAGFPKKKHVEVEPKVEESVASIANIQGAADTRLEGVGLVVGLENSGVDPPPSWYRQKLIDDMRKASVENPNAILKSPRVSMVIVHMTIPPGVSPKDRLDVDVEVPPACGTKSLEGGYLLSCRLREVMVLGGVPKEGGDAAIAQGPVMIGNLAKPDVKTVGRVLGGGRVRKEVPYQLIIKENRRSFRTAALLEGVINQRFPQTEGVNQKGSATAKTDQFIVLKVPRVYHQNQDRFFRVVKLLPMVDSPALRVQRMAAWAQQLLDPATAGIAALRLEGLGVTACEALKAALASPNAQVGFLAAEALAYLNDASGADVLAETATKRPEFRAYALAALAAMDQPAAYVKLRKLMDEPDVEVRYGAFNALRILASDDPFLGQVRVLEDSEDERADESTDSMAVAIARASSKHRVEDPFSLYLVDCEGPPMIHVARTRRCEVVVFGRGQRLLTPVVLGHGPILLNASEKDETLQISKIVPSRFGDADAKVVSSLELGDIIRQAAKLGANYPEIVSILQDAQKQRNLAGPLVVDAVPGTSPVYIQAAILGKDTTAKKDDSVLKTSGAAAKAKRPSLFDRMFRRSTSQPGKGNSPKPAASPTP
jgi:flagellar basal body P-ring protein FlgI